ncbi:Cleavage stimulating factor 64 [Quillaja saponaria]|uniref:Cleavage stimulating factor 64 n=1 Tax=Quillaja saponaria TaxID=32244 RepID=A0AAD7VGT8_QUISA|nr:Cleavage stimulating factor 64 [Quillaja saponaria]
MPVASSQLQQPMQGTGFPHLPLQPPLPPQMRLPSVSIFHHQYPPQMGPNMGFQHGAAPHNLQQSMFHSGAKPSVGISHLGTEFSNQVGNSMQTDRGSSWMTGHPEIPSITHLPGFPDPPSVVPGQIGTGNQPRRPPALKSEMEKALLQQVMSLTPEQINILPPEQRKQVVQLQQIPCQ